MKDEKIIEPIKIRRQRKDKERNIGKVAKAVIQNPLATQREIAKETGIGLGNVNRQLNDLEHNGTKDPRIVEICDKDLEIVKLGQKILFERLNKNPDEVRTRDVVSTMDTGTRRYTLFRGDITDKDGGLKAPITPEQRQKLLERLEIDE